MEHRFSQNAWADEAWSAARTSSALQNAGAEWVHGPLVLVVHESDQRAALAVDIHEGEIRSVRTLATPPAIAPWVLDATAEAWDSLLAGGAGALVDAIRAGRVRLHGDLTTLARASAMCDELLATLGNVPLPTAAPAQS